VSTAAPEVVEGVRDTIRKYGMVGAGDTVLAAVSGGADSVALLHVLLELGFAVEVAHLDHGTRDGDSAGDAVFVRDMAAGLGVPCHSECRGIEREADASPLSFEEYAREVRYAFLVRVAVERGCAAIATGHHADDQAETVLMRVLRGTTPRGLAGIPPVREDLGVRLIRPLLACTRERLEAYLAARGVAFRTDTTNTDTTYLRNRIRHDLLPQLGREYNPRVREALVRLAEVQRTEDDFLRHRTAPFLNACVDEHGSIRRAVFREGHPALQLRAILELAWRNGVDCEYEQASAGAGFVSDGPAGRSADLGGGVALRNSRDVTEIVTGPGQCDDRIISLAVPGDTTAFGRLFSVRFLDQAPAEPLAAYCRATRQVFDAARLGTSLSVRYRRPGDRFTPFGMTGSKKLKDYFIDVGVPAGQREAQVLLTADTEIVWVVGRAIGSMGAVTTGTTRFVEVEVSDALE
jgi:tRNA(Ile)-lysidine synthase